MAVPHDLFFPICDVDMTVFMQAFSGCHGLSDHGSGFVGGCWVWAFLHNGITVQMSLWTTIASMIVVL